MGERRSQDWGSKTGALAALTGATRNWNQSVIEKEVKRTSDLGTKTVEYWVWRSHCQLAE